MVWECLNCGSAVSERYVRILTSEGMDQPRCCPACPDRIRTAGGTVREPRSVTPTPLGPRSTSARPMSGRCRPMTDERRTLAVVYGVETVYTGSSMATHVHFDADCRQFTADTDVRDRPAESFPVGHRPVCPQCAPEPVADNGDEQAVMTDGGRPTTENHLADGGCVDGIERWIPATPGNRRGHTRTRYNQSACFARHLPRRHRRWCSRPSSVGSTKSHRKNPWINSVQTGVCGTVSGDADRSHRRAGVTECLRGGGCIARPAPLSRRLPSRQAQSHSRRWDIYLYGQDTLHRSGRTDIFPSSAYLIVGKPSGRHFRSVATTTDRENTSITGESPMVIERRQSSPDSSETVVTTACPYCGTPIAEQESLADHLRGNCTAIGGNR